jgi:lysozyme
MPRKLFRVSLLKRLLVAVLVCAAGAAGAYAAFERGYLHLNYPSRKTFPVRGIDVSSHQRSISWRALVEATDIEFAFIKASEGKRVRDRRFLANWHAADGLVARGAYHFFTFCSPGAAQAGNFLSAVPSRGELPMAVDVEFAGNCGGWTSLEDIRAELRAFLLAVEAATDRKPILYVTRSSYARLVQGYFDGYPLWVREVVVHPTEPQYPGLAFWQYAGNGRAPGVKGLIDLNTFVGSRAEFAAFLKP